MREDASHYAGLLAEAKARDLELLCANPDLVVRVGERLWVCAGAVAAEYEKLGGRVVMAGKPFAPIYRLAFAEIDGIAGRVVDKTRILAVGDGVGTDIAGANAAGLDALFIASGIHNDFAAAETALAREGAHADYIMEHLA